MLSLASLLSSVSVPSGKLRLVLLDTLMLVTSDPW
jgi:hypothetical protein